MKKEDIIIHRLINQQIAFTEFTKPEEIVNWMGAMQAQEYAMAKWAIGLRLKNVNDEIMETAFNEGRILRTHLLRPTWHFVSPEEIRWLVALTAPRVNAINAYMYRKTGLDAPIFKRSHQVIEKALGGGKYLTRTVLQLALEKAKIPADGVRLSCLMMEAELLGLICSGPREGKQFTYALLEERVPSVKTFKREEALATLTTKFFRSRGPATLQDFAYWSGLTNKDAKDGFEMVKEQFAKEIIEGIEYVFTANDFGSRGLNDKGFQNTFLMPDYDEYGMGYKNREAIFNPQKYKDSVSRGNPVYNRMLITNGIITGTWHRTIQNNKLIVDVLPFEKLDTKSNKAVIEAVKGYSNFIGKALEE